MKFNKTQLKLANAANGTETFRVRVSHVKGKTHTLHLIDDVEDDLGVAFTIEPAKKYPVGSLLTFDTEGNLVDSKLPEKAVGASAGTSSPMHHRPAKC